MTLKQAYEYTLMEMRKVKAPHIHLEEFNYYSNKAVQECINISVKSYETTQQTADDLSALSDNVEGIFNINNTITYTGQGYNGVKTTKSGNLYGSDYIQFVLPDNYMHILGLVPTIMTKFNYKCHRAGYEYSSGSTKLTSDLAGEIASNAFLRPSIFNTYHKIIDSGNINSTIPDIQLFYGNSRRTKAKGFYLSYIKKPQVLNLTSQQVSLPIDSSQILEFPDYVCNEIIKKITILIMENAKDQRINTFIPVNKSIDNSTK